MRGARAQPQCSPAQSTARSTLPRLSSPACAAHYQDAHLSAICYDLADTLSFAFVRAVSDNIPSLKEYAGASSSVFLFYMVRVAPCAAAAAISDLRTCRSVVAVMLPHGRCA